VPEPDEPVEPVPVPVPVPVTDEPEPDEPVVPEPEPGTVVDPGPVAGTVVVPDPTVGAVVVGGTEATKLFRTVVAHVTALPPPVAVPLHWLTVTGSAEVAPVTVQPTVGSPA
jgi:hypothetical protein